MKFKEYLKETEMNEYTKHKLSELISLRAIPLSEPMMKRLGYYWEDTVVYHLTNSKNLPGMTKDQNKKAHISTFSKGGAELARLPSQPDVLLRLKGDEVIQGKSDIWSLTDTQNRRWLDIKTDSKGGETLYNFLNGVLQKVLNQNDLNIELQRGKSFGGDRNLEVELNKLTKKQRSKIYGMYIEEVERFLNSSYKYLNTYLNNLNQFHYNEIILTNWEILDVKSIEIESPLTVKMCAELGLVYSGVIPRKRLSGLVI